MLTAAKVPLLASRRPSRRGVSRNKNLVQLGVEARDGRPSRRGVSRNMARYEAAAKKQRSPLPQGRE